MANIFKNKFQKWVNNRIPPSHEIALGHRQLFIFSSRAGWMYLTIMILMLIGATNYQNSLGFVWSFLMLAIGLLTILKSFNNLKGLALTGLSCQAVFAGEKAKFLIAARSEKGAFSLGFGFKGQTQQWLDIPPNESISFELQQEMPLRGWHQSTRIYLHSEYPLGLLRCWSWIDLNQKVLVFPKPQQPPEVNKYFQIEADPAKGTLQPGDDFEDSRRYQEGDSPRHIDWKVYAKTEKLYTKKFEKPVSNEIWLDFDQFEGIDKELRLSFLSYLVIKSELSNQPYGLKLGNQTIGPSQGDKHQYHCLAALATFGDPPIPETPKSQNKRFKWLRILFSRKPGVINHGQ